MAVVPARRRGGRVKRRRSGPNVHVQSAGSRYKHTNAIPGPKKAPQIDGRKFSQDSIGFDAGSSGDSASASNTTRASQQGKNSASISKIPYQEDEFPTTPQDLEASEILAHAIVRGFKMRAAKRLPNFLQRRASANNTITGNIIEIQKSRLDGNALIITVKAVDLPKITGLNGVSFAGTRLAIRPYRVKKSIHESHVCSAKGTSVSQTETSIQIPTADSPRLASDQSADRSQHADTTLLASQSLENTRPEVDMNILPGLNFLAAASVSNTPLQKDPKLQAIEEMTDVPISNPTKTKEEEIAIQLSETTGISLSISHLCLSQSDWDLELAREAIHFAAEFASLNGLALQASILCLDYSLWDMDNATLFLSTVVRKISDKTGMNMEWTIECLAANEWTAKVAIETFEDVKGLLPSEAFRKK